MSEVEATGAEVAAEQAGTSGGKGKLLGGLLVLAAAAGGGAWYAGLLGGAEADPAAPAAVQPAIYFDVDDNLVVNFQGGGRMRYLQLGVQVMTRDPAAVEALKRHHPVVRNNLIMLFSEQSYESLSTRDGKAALAEAALAEVQSVLQDDYPGPGVEAVYFTSFVMQ